MKRIILSGGGTGGHIYPAVAVAEALKRKWGDEVELLFVGAEGKMEMDKIPALGYRIVGLPILGLQRRFTWKNFTVPFRVLRSISKARRTIRDFGADAVVGFGGYASAPVLAFRPSFRSRTLSPALPTRSSHAARAAYASLTTAWRRSSRRRRSR